MQKAVGQSGQSGVHIQIRARMEAGPGSTHEAAKRTLILKLKRNVSESLKGKKGIFYTMLYTFLCTFSKLSNFVFV